MVIPRHCSLSAVHRYSIGSGAMPPPCSWILFKVILTLPKSVRLVCLAALCAVGMLFLLSCQRAHGAASPRSMKMIILGVDGLDPDLLTKFMADGKMPNFARLAEQGSFRRLTTSIPPQSPVAWSNLITGMNAGGHGIFDFIHRDPKTFQLYFSTSKVEGPEHSFPIGKWVIPLGSGSAEQLAPRQGVLGDSRRESHAQFCVSHPGKFSSDRRQGEDAFRYGHARSARHLRHFHFLHGRPNRGRGRRRRRRDCSGRGEK